MHEEVPPEARRTGPPWSLLSAYLAVPGALAAALWITCGRSLLGAGGDLVWVFALSFGPLLALVLLVAAYLSFKERTLQGGKSAGFAPSICLPQTLTWVLAAIFGMLVPDRVEGKTISAAAKIFGEGFIGLSAGFGNTFGILTFCFAFATLICSISALRRARRLAAGITEDDVEAAERAASSYEFLDDEGA